MGTAPLIDVDPVNAGVKETPPVPRTPFPIPGGGLKPTIVPAREVIEKVHQFTDKELSMVRELQSKIMEATNMLNGALFMIAAQNDVQGKIAISEDGKHLTTTKIVQDASVPTPRTAAE